VSLHAVKSEAAAATPLQAQQAQHQHLLAALPTLRDAERQAIALFASLASRGGADAASMPPPTSLKREAESSLEALAASAHAEGLTSGERLGQPPGGAAAAGRLADCVAEQPPAAGARFGTHSTPPALSQLLDALHGVQRSGGAGDLAAFRGFGCAREQAHALLGPLGAIEGTS